MDHLIFEGEGGGGTFANCAMCPLPLGLYSIFLGVRPLNAIRSHNLSCDKRIWIYMYYSRFGFVFFCFCITERISSDNFRK